MLAAGAVILVVGLRKRHLEGLDLDMSGAIAVEAAPAAAESVPNW